MTPEQLQEYATKVAELNKEYNVTLEGFSGVRVVDLSPKEDKTEEKTESTETKGE